MTAPRRDEEEAARALQGMQGRYYAGKPIVVEFSPVTDFREATCRQYEENNCSRGGYCNFMHVRPVTRELRKQVRGGAAAPTAAAAASGPMSRPAVASCACSCVQGRTVWQCCSAGRLLRSACCWGLHAVVLPRIPAHQLCPS